jgi:DNA polymerase-1
MGSSFNFYQKYWTPIQRIVSDMEGHGVLVDKEAAQEASAELLPELEQLNDDLNEWAGREINWGSPKQVSEFLYGEKRYSVPPIVGGEKTIRPNFENKPSTSEIALQYIAAHLDDEEGEDKRNLKKLQDLKKKSRARQFVVGLPEHMLPSGRVHCQFAPECETGRLTSKNPCLHQLPEAARIAVKAPPGHVLLCLDDSGLEWRIVAHILAKKYGDFSLVNDVKAGINPHAATAVRMFDQCKDLPVEWVKEKKKKLYDASKTLNYRTIYGVSPSGIGAAVSDESGEPIGAKRGREYIIKFYQANPGIERFHQDILDYVRRHGYVRSLLGRYRPIPGPWAKRKWRSGISMKANERQAANVVQNCAADIVYLQMLAIAKRYPELKMILQVHDELVLEVPEDRADEVRGGCAEEMRNCLEGVRDFLCPLDVEGGYAYNWKDAK